MLATFAGGGLPPAVAAPLLLRPQAAAPPAPAQAWLPLPIAACGLAAASRRGARVGRRGARADLSAQGILKTVRGEKKFPAPTPKLLQAAPVEAQAALVKHRQQSIRRGKAALRPFMRDNARLPLVIKYHKPEAVHGVMRGGSYKEKGKQISRPDLRSVVSYGGDRFELDYYEPVGQLSKRTSGLMLWTRRTDIAVNLLDETRLVTSLWRADVAGAVDEEELREMMREGVNVGDAGFQELVYADLRRAQLLPTDNIQQPRSRVEFATRMEEEQIRPCLLMCGHVAKAIKRTGLGAFKLDTMKPGHLRRATMAEEEWVCGLAGCHKRFWPQNRLPEAKEIFRLLTGQKPAKKLPSDKEPRVLPS